MPSEEKILKAIQLEANGILPASVIGNLAESLNLRFDRIFYRISERDIRCGAFLSHQEKLGSMERMWLLDVDLASVPTQHMVSLIACMTKLLVIHTIGGCNLVSLLDSVSTCPSADRNWAAMRQMPWYVQRSHV